MLIRQLLCMACWLTLAGCDAIDPYTQRRHVAAERRQRRQSAGHGCLDPPTWCGALRAPDGDGQQAAAALDRYRNDKVRLLPDSAVAKIVPIAGGSGPQGSQ